MVSIAEGAGAGVLGNYSYTWASNSTMVPSIGTGLTQNNLAAGTYYVMATRNAVVSPLTPGVSGSGCVTAPAPLTVLDKRVFPTVSFATIASSSCDANYDGKITVTAATATGPGAGPGDTYNFVWTSDPDGGGALFSASNSATNNTASPFATTNTDLIGPGGYTIRVTNFVTQCFTDGNVNVSQNTIPMSVSSVTSTDVDLCSSNNGSGTLVSIAEGAGPGVLGNYSYTWAANSSMVPSIGTGLTQNNLAAGTYYVMATRNAVVSPLTPGVSGSGCVTAPAPLTVLDKRVFPTVSFATIASSSCDANYDGKITVTAATATGPGAGPGDTYNFVWTSDPDGGGPLFSASNSATNNTASPFATVNTDLIGPGGYTIRVTNFVTQCFTDGNVNVSQNTIPMSVSSVTSTNVDLCSSNNGSGTLVSIAEGAGSGVLGNYSYTWASNSTMVPSIGTGLTQNNLAAGTYYVMATRNAVVSPLTPGVSGSGCVTAPAPLTVLDKRVFPTVSFATIASSSCDANYDGKITVTAATATGPGAGPGDTYNFVWTSDPDGGGPLFSASNSATNNTASPFATVNTDLIGPGGYTIRVTNFVTQCFTDGNVNVSQNTIPMSVSSVTSTNVDLCSSNNGSGTLVSIAEGAGAGVLGNYSYTWASNSTMVPSIGTGLTQNNLAAGTYYVMATRNAVVSPLTPGVSGSGCVTAPAPLTVLDKRVFPTVSFATIASTACDANYDGKITVTAATASGQPAVATSNYNFVWTANPGGAVVVTDGTNVGSPYSTLAGDKVGPGSYTTRVTNIANQCFSDANVSVVSDPTELQILTFTKTDQAICNPDGSITILTLNSGTPANYSFTWFRKDPTTAALVDGLTAQIIGSVLQPGAGAGQYPTMGADSYFVTGIKNAGATPGSGCSTPPFEVDIKDLHVDPIIAAATLNPDVNCAGGAGAGKIAINEATPLNYTYLWFTGDDISGTPVLSVGGVNGEIAQALQEGDYTVQVRTNATNCTSVESYTISNNPTIVSFDPAGFTAPAVTTCNLATGVPSNGTATVISILENNISQPLTNYTFTWTDVANTILPNSPLPTLVGVSPGSYFVKATNTLTNCIADHSFQIDDNTIGSTVTLISFGQPEKCVNPTTGFLTAQGGGTWPGPFTYEWYAGDQRPSPAGAPLAVGNTLSPIPIAPDQIFTVKTINSNNCWVVDAYSIPLIVNPVTIVASTNPLTFCTSDNGEIFSTVVNDNLFDYNFFWGKGTAVHPPDDYTTNDVHNLPAGVYTVVAIDKLDPGCISPTVTVTIDNEQVIPVVTAEVLKGLTICDPARPDGVASADVASDFVHYTFNWFVGSSASGTSFYTGAEVGNLAATSYTVVATETSTGCSGSATVTVPTNFAVVPTPTVTVTSNVTSCIDNNGELSATVGGVTKDYIFDWRNGTKAPPPIDFTGEIYTGLAVGQYTVVATSRITGCVSSPATAPITNDQLFPTFEFLVKDANCTTSDGFISILITNNVVIDHVTWSKDGAFVADGPNLENVMAGTYQVMLTTELGCEATENVMLPANINVFNGVSKLADGKNDFFLIDCIEQYPQNHVEIFNRAGTKVYEADGYDNVDVLFDGKSNRGISIMGTNLPAGTYFYIISKGDGSKHLAGYLELVD